MAVEMVRVRNPETGAEAELPATAVGRKQFENWQPVDPPQPVKGKSARGTNPQQEG